MKRIITILASVIFLTTCTMCEKNGKQRDVPTDQIAQEDVLFLDTIGIENLPINSMIGADGNPLNKHND